MTFKQLKKIFPFIDEKYLMDMVDIAAYVVHCMFHTSGDDYRMRAIRALVASRLPWNTNTNILHETFEFLHPSFDCPYCGGKITKVCGGGGGSSEYTIRMKCPTCNTVVSFTLPTNGGISINPGEAAKIGAFAPKSIHSRKSQ